MELTLTGTAYPKGVDGTAANAQPFSATFTVDTLSGTADYQFANGQLGRFTANPIVTDFNALVGTDQFSIAQTTGSAGGDRAPGGSIMFDAFSLNNVGFLWEIDARAPSNLGNDPLGAIMSYWSSGIGSLPGFNLEISGVKESVVSVPEPGTLEMLAFSLLGLLVLHRSKRAQSQRTERYAKIS
ncbi:MAG: hypothetical protein JOZ03_14855 [Gammaproteobacteria bacterium]|nr:hypothetical protein [Gammaproteobacteria bacterium]